MTDEKKLPDSLKPCKVAKGTQLAFTVRVDERTLAPTEYAASAKSPQGYFSKGAFRKAKPEETSKQLATQQRLIAVEAGKVVLLTAASAPPPSPLPPARMSCPPVEGSAVVCVNLTGNSRSVEMAPSRNVVLPNQGLVVHVQHDSDEDVKVTWGGTRGLSEHKINDARGPRKGGAMAPGKREAPTAITSSFRFAPRKAGAANLTIEAKKPKEQADGSSQTVTDTVALELEVESLSWGAARFGVAAVFGDAVSNAYEARTHAGSQQLQIAQADPGIGFEGVLGFAPYLLDLWFCDGRGRSHTGGCNYYVAPYLGLGILGQASEGVQSFGAIYAGLEVEFASSFSVAATAVWRQVTTLADGYYVGSPVTTDTDFTRDAAGFGFGLLINATPDLFQFQTASSSNGTASSAPAPAEDAEEESQ